MQCIPFFPHRLQYSLLDELQQALLELYVDFRFPSTVYIRGCCWNLLCQEPNRTSGTPC